MTKSKKNFKSGFITITGAANAGKSTLLNRVLGEKISITSKKAQTTRNRMLGILHRPQAQLVFVDTPGIHKPKGTLNTRMVNTAVAAMGDVDVILFIIDLDHRDFEAENTILKNLKAGGTPAILALNKIDLVVKQTILPVVEYWNKAYHFKAIVPLSAQNGDQVDDLLNEMEAALPEGPPYFPEDTLTDVPVRQLAAELIREKVFRFTGQEIPYSTAVTVEKFKKAKSITGKTLIHAVIHIERASQKGIIIGKKGVKLKKIGEEARRAIERLLDAPVFLELFVRVQKNWTNDTRALRRFGY